MSAGAEHRAEPHGLNARATTGRDSIRIAETFSSIQGEGRLMGTPSFFVRFSGCNLRCGWCDTPYASWDPEGERRSVDSLITEVRDSGVKHVVVTGGEPMMFDQVVPLCEGLRSAGIHITIETAGTVYQDVYCDLMSISPKLANSRPSSASGWSERHEQRRIDIGVLNQLLTVDAEVQLKFVVTSHGDLKEIDDLLSQLRGWSENDIFLMPEGIEAPAPEFKDTVTAMCSERAWNYGHRLHIELFGNVRGT